MYPAHWASSAGQLWAEDFEVDCIQHSSRMHAYVLAAVQGFGNNDKRNCCHQPKGLYQRTSAYTRCMQF